MTFLFFASDYANGHPGQLSRFFADGFFFFADGFFSVLLYFTRIKVASHPCTTFVRPGLQVSHITLHKHSLLVNVDL